MSIKQKFLTQDGTKDNIFYPITDTNAVYDENGNRLTNILNESQDNISQLAETINNSSENIGQVQEDIRQIYIKLNSSNILKNPPEATTATIDTNTAQVATTKFVRNIIGGRASSSIDLNNYVTPCEIYIDYNAAGFGTLTNGPTREQIRTDEKGIRSSWSSNSFLKVYEGYEESTAKGYQIIQELTFFASNAKTLTYRRILYSKTKEVMQNWTFINLDGKTNDLDTATTEYVDNAVENLVTEKNLATQDYVDDKISQIDIVKFDSNNTPYVTNNNQDINLATKEYADSNYVTKNATINNKIESNKIVVQNQETSVANADKRVRNIVIWSSGSQPDLAIGDILIKTF